VNPDGGFQNITEWAKKELCWKRVAELEIPITPAFYKELVDKDIDVQLKRDSAAEQKLESGIEQQTAVLELGAAYWKEIREFGAREGLLSGDDVGILSVAVAIPKKIPTEKQCARLLQIKSRSEAEGFPVRVTAKGAS
jgi:hypothetical protein